MNILQSLFGTFTNDRLSALSHLLGERPAAVQRAIGAALPAILGGAVSKASSDEGASDLLGLLQRQNSDADHLDEALRPGRALEDARNSGGAILGNLFGSNFTAIADSVKSFSGMKGDGAGLLMGIAAPAVMSTLAKAAPTGELTSASIRNLLGEQKGFLPSLTPPTILQRLGQMPGLGDFLSSTKTSYAANTNTPETRPRPRLVTSSTSSSVLSSAHAMPGARGAHVDPFVRRIQTSQTRKLERSPPSMMQWGLMGLLALFFLTLGLNSCQSNSVRQIVMDPRLTEQVGPRIEVDPAPPPRVVTPAATQPAAAIGAEAGETATDIRLRSFLESDERAPRAFILQNLNFETASAQLTQESRATVLAAIRVLHDFPQVVVRIDGHTDNRGSTSFNRTLSEERARTVADMLVAEGIERQRVSSAGFGPEAPIASNDTEEGRLQNRRVELVVTRK